METLLLRLKSFGFNILGVVTTAVVAYLLSPDFSTWVTENFGSGAITVLAMAVMTEALRHFRNKIVIGRATKLGAVSTSNIHLL